MTLKSLLGAAGATLILTAGLQATAHDLRETVTPAFEEIIPNIPGKSLAAAVVDYAPGAASVPHLHADTAFIFAYVLSGAIESQVNGGEMRVYQAGESWSEPPGAHHGVSRNVSATEPAKLLAVFVVDTGEKNLTTPLE